MSQPTLLTSMHRTADVQQNYINHIEKKKKANDSSCDMCRLIAEKPVNFTIDEVADNPSDALQFVTVCLIENEFPYENTDGRRVLLHHMLVPKQHYSKSSQLPEDVRNEYHETLDALLDTGVYDSAYTRSTYSPTSSVPLHLHTHLFKFGPKVVKQLFDPSNDINEITFENA